jgi:hypothetical protein
MPAYYLLLRITGISSFARYERNAVFWKPDLFSSSAQISSHSLLTVERCGCERCPSRRFASRIPRSKNPRALDWQGRSPNLASLNFSFWGMWSESSRVFISTKCQHLKQRDREAVATITPDVLSRVRQQKGMPLRHFSEPPTQQRWKSNNPVGKSTLKFL